MQGGRKYDQLTISVFLHVAEQGSFSKAAALLYVTPAAIMKHMNTLEKRLGVKLLNRTNHGIELTSAGESLYQDGKKLLDESQKALDNTRLAERTERVIVRVGSSLLNPSRVLTDFWSPLMSSYPQYKFRIVPFEDTKEQILSVVASLGDRLDLLVGALNSKHMHEHACYLPLGAYKLCIAVPKEHPLARKKLLSLRDLYGEKLVMMKKGDTEPLDDLRDMLRKEHPQIIIEETGFYDMDTFYKCEENGSLLLTLNAWADVHPALVTVDVDWERNVPYGILYSKKSSDRVMNFLKIIEENIRVN